MYIKKILGTLRHLFIRPVWVIDYVLVRVDKHRDLLDVAIRDMKIADDKSRRKAMALNNKMLHNVKLSSRANEVIIKMDEILHPEEHRTSTSSSRRDNLIVRRW